VSCERQSATHPRGRGREYRDADERLRGQRRTGGLARDTDNHGAAGAVPRSRPEETCEQTGREEGRRRRRQRLQIRATRGDRGGERRARRAVAQMRAHAPAAKRSPVAI
jgi:hypothetical protein